MTDKEKVALLRQSLWFLIGTCRSVMEDYNSYQHFDPMKYKIDDEMAGYVDVFNLTKEESK